MKHTRRLFFRFWWGTTLVENPHTNIELENPIIIFFSVREEDFSSALSSTMVDGSTSSSLSHSSTRFAYICAWSLAIFFFLKHLSSVHIIVLYLWPSSSWSTSLLCGTTEHFAKGAFEWSSFFFHLGDEGSIYIDFLWFPGIRILIYENSSHLFKFHFSSYS